MKFGKRLQYESVVEWEDKYLAYKELKFLITSVITQMKVTATRMNEPGTRKFNKAMKSRQSVSLSTFNPSSTNESSPLLRQSENSNEVIKAQNTHPINAAYGEDSPLIMEQGASDMPELSKDRVDSQSVRAQNLRFFKRFGDEMAKVNDFFTRKETEMQSYYAKLIEAVDTVMTNDPSSPTKLKQLKTAFVEFYRGLCMLENYVELNCEGFRKILKKHQKLTGLSSQEQTLHTLHQQHFYKSSSWREMMTATESLYAKVYQIGKPYQAKSELLPTRLEDTSASNMFKLGIAIGVCIAFVLVIFFLFSHGAMDPNVDWKRFIAVIPVYRAVAIPVIALWFWGCNVYIWTKKRVNYIFIFGFDPRSSLDYRRIFKAASTLTAVWLASFFLFVATVMGNFSIFKLRPEIYPLMLILFNVALVLFPFRALHRRSRFILFRTLYNVIISPFGDIHFMALYVGDVLCSMVKTLFDIEYTICYYATGDWLTDNGTKCQEVNRVALPVLSALPYFWRLLQCLKRYRATGLTMNLGNAGKYGVACCVIVFGGINGYQSYPAVWTPLRIVWLVAFCFATCYNYLWDVFMDWSLGRKQYGGLRKVLLYRPHVWVYYYVILSNLVLRFAWTAYITPAQIYVGINPEFFATILAVVEIFRRFTWSVFRVENEQITNTGANRALTFAALPTELREAEIPAKGVPPVTAISGVWTGKGPFDVIVEFLQKNNKPGPESP